jgi:hypothetical protein
MVMEQDFQLALGKEGKILPELVHITSLFNHEDPINPRFACGERLYGHASDYTYGRYTTMVLPPPKPTHVPKTQRSSVQDMA